MRKWVLAMFLMILLATSFPVLQNLQVQQANQNINALENAIQTALTLCYAQEGFYPAQIEYLVEHYGLQTNPSRFFVYYKTFGSNIRPDVKVYRLGDTP